ncbi:hypothetical protein AACH06_20320 [Ideonella sp. DXS29W]|uniref:Uncharacterized protein n=1 Tax=Ideonella lacteola TaxID=2984193 RepID=A0ABU9BTI7_9BURK
MFKKILIANRGENDCGAGVSAKPDGMARKACAGDFVSMEKTDV